MSRRPPIEHHYTGLYILTDADGFTTACYPSRECLFKEAERRPLLAPIEIVHWLRVGMGDKWKRVSDWTWNGGLEVGA